MILERTENGIEYDYYYTGPDGAHFILYPTADHTKEQVDAAKRELRNDRDVVSLRVDRNGPPE